MVLITGHFSAALVVHVAVQRAVAPIALIALHESFQRFSRRYVRRCLGRCASLSRAENGQPIVAKPSAFKNEWRVVGSLSS